VTASVNTSKTVSQCPQKPQQSTIDCSVGPSMQMYKHDSRSKRLLLSMSIPAAARANDSAAVLHNTVLHQLRCQLQGPLRQGSLLHVSPIGQTHRASRQQPQGEKCARLTELSCQSLVVPCGRQVSIISQSHHRTCSRSVACPQVQQVLQQVHSACLHTP
jgi:hypothetical protein